MSYTKTVWNEKSVPGISGAKLNKIEQGIYEAHERIANMQEIPSGGTSADAALYDINIGFDGTNHGAPGDSVRAQAQQLDDKINEVSGQLSSEIVNQTISMSGARNLFNADTFIKDKEMTDTGLVDNTNGYGVSDFIPVISGKTLYFSRNGAEFNVPFLSLFDKDKNYIGKPSLITTYTVQNNVSYVVACIHYSDTLDTFQIEYDRITPYKPYTDISMLQGNIDNINKNMGLGVPSNDVLLYHFGNVNLFNIETFEDNKAFSGGNIVDTNGYGVTDFIPVVNGKTLYFSIDGQPITMNFVYAYNGDKEYLNGITYANSYDIHNDVKYVRFCIAGNSTTLAKLKIEYDKVTEYTSFANVNEIIDHLYNGKKSDNPLKVINDTPNLISCFLNVGCIGDSLASGVSVYKDLSGEVVVNSQNRYEYSWGQYLARMTGNKYYNWSAGGMRTDTWLNSAFATECFDGNHLCQAYIIGLGQNDNNASAGADIGTIADIDISNYNNNANSFYGRYAKIIQKIKEVNPKAKIFVITDPNNSVDANGYNVAIRNIAEMFDSVYLLDMQRYWASSACIELLERQKRYAHFNAVGYFLIAKMIMTYIDWIMENNPDDFREIENIGTDWYWYD